MVLHYRETDPVSGRWTGNTSGVKLSSAQADENTYTLASQIAAVQASVTASRSISSITTSGDQLTFHMTDSTLEGPFTIPVASFLDRGAWAPVTAYSINDTFHVNGTLYLNIYPNISAATFSAGANDGAGHNYYSAMLSLPANSLPAGGATDWILGKSSSADYAYSLRPSGLPRGGSTHQVPKKNSGTDFDYSLGYVALSELSDVDIVGTPTLGDVLTYVADTSGNYWTPAPMSGGALQSLTDVNVTEGSSINGYFLQWNNATSKWVAAASSATIAGLSDVNVTEGSGIDGYFLKWNNSTGKWIAAASSGSLSGLADVNVTEGSGINGYFLKWDNSTSKWVASVTGATAVALTGLTDVNVTEGPSINGYFLQWNNATSKWVAAASSATLAGLSDVNVTEGTGINGYFLKWNSSTSKWIAQQLATVAVSGAYSDLSGRPTIPTALSALSDVNVSEGASIDGYALKWDNATSKWIASASAGGTTYSAGTGLTLTGATFSVDGTIVGRLATANTWALAQTFTVAPVFTDAAGTRTALGLGTAATQASTAFQAADAQLSSLIRQNSQSANYTTVLTDGGRHILHPSADTTARTFTIDSNANVAFPVGTALTFVNQNVAGVITIAITTDTMRLAGAGTVGNRTLAANGIATALKITSTEWIISGTGLT